MLFKFERQAYMKIQIRLTKALADFNNGKKEVVCSIEPGQGLNGLIQVMDQQMNGIRSKILSRDNTIRDSINVYVNGENVRYLGGLSTILSDGDQVGIIPAAAAG